MVTDERHSLGFEGPVLQSLVELGHRKALGYLLEAKLETLVLETPEVDKPSPSGLLEVEEVVPRDGLDKVYINFTHGLYTTVVEVEAQ